MYEPSEPNRVPSKTQGIVMKREPKECKSQKTEKMDEKKTQIQQVSLLQP